ncbi:hypothetical protein CsSME_00016051 [Camellia sinensis var. sinensis]
MSELVLQRGPVSYYTFGKGHSGPTLSSRHRYLPFTPAALSQHSHWLAIMLLGVGFSSNLLGPIEFGLYDG